MPVGHRVVLHDDLQIAVGVPRRDVGEGLVWRNRVGEATAIGPSWLDRTQDIRHQAIRRRRWCDGLNPNRPDDAARSRTHCWVDGDALSGLNLWLGGRDPPDDGVAHSYIITDLKRRRTAARPKSEHHLVAAIFVDVPDGRMHLRRGVGSAGQLDPPPFLSGGSASGVEQNRHPSIRDLAEPHDDFLARVIVQIADRRKRRTIGSIRITRQLELVPAQHRQVP